MNKHMEAYLDIRDVLYVKGSVEVDDMILDAIVNVIVVQTGTNRLEIEYFEVKDDIVYLAEDNDELIVLNYNASPDTATGKTMERFTKEIDRVAFEIAKNTPEHEWKYRLIDC